MSLLFIRPCIYTDSIRYSLPPSPNHPNYNIRKIFKVYYNHSNPTQIKLYENHSRVFISFIPNISRSITESNSLRLFTPGETKALAKSKVHQISRAWVTNRGWSSLSYTILLEDLLGIKKCRQKHGGSDAIAMTTGP
jgi:hypothetical protein